MAIRVAWPFGQGLSFRAYAIASTTVSQTLPFILDSRFPIPDSRFPKIVNSHFIYYTSIIGIVKGESTDEQVCWYH
ncbi:MAG: hypothetical protein F6J94_15565 [Moorea sp. SIO1F2]|uniref:hypothetical protein n=1 Tax=Moorena sp. SIO1F2 TaxID=2607819 RepID=UPI0013BDFC83|nr:hypothetical protein [Moorena sp. SIO1F2]NET83280.1 hypothetical protein [Moorena sp. SIO1F2]